ncbi:MAG: phosphoribosylglycinamide formyltransferase [Acidimicrobiaceae bacterium]|nr:phosphoribosylglycinamide formyltransferase [Acidimicrobiaceae bacterium]
MTKRIVVLVSGNGGNLQAILDAVDDGRLAARVVGVVSNRPAVRALQRATTAGVPTVVVEPQPAETRVQYDERLRDAVEAWRPDIVVLAGFMRVLSPGFLDAFPQAVVNIHPALPGELPGIRAIERAHAQAQDGLRTHSGVMVHLVPDAGVDTGPVLAAVQVAMPRGESLADFAARMHEAEHHLLVRALVEFLDRPLVEKTHQPLRFA